MHGALPYRDFVFVQPPGIAVVMAPVAFLARFVGSGGAMSIARVVTAVVVGLNALLAANLLRRRSLAGALLAGLLLAVFPPAYFADHSLLLEPYVICCCLAGWNLAFRRGELAGTGRLAAAGALIGLGGSIKLWALVPALALLVVLRGAARQSTRAYLVGCGGAFLLICLPFFAGAPDHFVHDIFATQFGRQSSSPRQPSLRLWGIVGLHGFALNFSWRRHQDWGFALGALIGAVLLVGLGVPTLRRRAGRLECSLLLAAIGAVALLFVPVEYYDHYTYFSAPFLALALGCATARAVALWRRHARPPSATWRLSLVLVVVLTLASSVGLVALSKSVLRFDTSALSHYTLDYRLIDRFVPAGACVTGDDASLLIEADRFDSSAAGCPDVVDSDGTWLAENPSAPTGVVTSSDRQLVALWEGYFARSDYVVLRAADTFRIPWKGALRSWFDARFMRIGPGNLAIYRRR